MANQLIVHQNGVVECNCDVSALYGECKHIQARWLALRVIELESTIVDLHTQIEALRDELDRASALPESIQQALNSGDGSYRP